MSLAAQSPNQTPPNNRRSVDQQLGRIIAEHLGTKRRTHTVDKIFGRALTDPLPNRNILTTSRLTSNRESMDERVALARDGCSDFDIVRDALVQHLAIVADLSDALVRAARAIQGSHTRRSAGGALRAHRDRRRDHRRTRPAPVEVGSTSYLVRCDAIGYGLKTTRQARGRRSGPRPLHRRSVTARSRAPLDVVSITGMTTGDIGKDMAATE